MEIVDLQENVELEGGIIISAKDIKEYFCPKATPKEIQMALNICKSLNLNPHKREVYFIKYEDRSVMQIITGYDVYIKRAERSGKLNGWNVSLKDGTARLEIHRKDWKEPFIWEVDLKEFNKRHSAWSQIPSFMAKKVAISQGFRLCFPLELSDLPYTKDEEEVYFDKDEGCEAPNISADEASKQCKCGKKQCECDNEPKESKEPKYMTKEQEEELVKYEKLKDAKEYFSVDALSYEQAKEILESLKKC